MSYKSKRHSFQHWTILVIDACRPRQRGTASRLRGKGYIVETASTWSEALSIILSRQPDMIMSTQTVTGGMSRGNRKASKTVAHFMPGRRLRNTDYFRAVESILPAEMDFAS